MIELLKEAKRHYEQLAPHVKSRETAKLLKALIDALDNQWQPIETAPRDGSWFQAYDKKSEWRTGVPSVCVVYVNKDGKFTDINNTNRANLTHWQPLPQPPKQ